MYDNIRVSPGSSFKVSAHRCLHCECIEQGSQCCEHGFSVSVVESPEAYDACNSVFVNKNDPFEICQKTIIHMGK